MAEPTTIKTDLSVVVKILEAVSLMIEGVEDILPAQDKQQLQTFDSALKSFTGLLQKFTQ
jgi:hypothetical protein